ncbi:adenine phosphoribosyltransferase [Bimuria novae-zelandiae CBS 107.79]|uniref:adenine phosphoribosyltransferase n=1 Tax=Bimuria novae-zelandiae CBS 107.79 TaxID=1447943 RepID=A0A6A5UV60_9PLEO|nr:adenine phosphoribosyltransferase [Bimuria novae-zelandiae CBS 107.79]
MSGVHPNSTSPPSHTSTAEHPAPPHQDSTASHPPPGKPDPTLTGSATGGDSDHAAAQRGLAAAGASPTAELASLTLRLKNSLRQFPDFPSPGILFEDIMPLFADAKLHDDLIRALSLHVSQNFDKPDVVVGLDARGFLFGPSLALRLGAGFAPVRKKGKLPGPCETAGYEKEYGSDFFQMQADAVKPGQKVLVVDDIIATGGSAQAAGSLVKKLGGTLLGYAFILELDFLKGRDKLDAPVYTLLSSQGK